MVCVNKRSFPFLSWFVFSRAQAVGKEHCSHVKIKMISTRNTFQRVLIQFNALPVSLFSMKVVKRLAALQWQLSIMVWVRDRVGGGERSLSVNRVGHTYFRGLRAWDRCGEIHVASGRGGHEPRHLGAFRLILA